jgi:hypothetical protein
MHKYVAGRVFLLRFIKIRNLICAQGYFPIFFTKQNTVKLKHKHKEGVLPMIKKIIMLIMRPPTLRFAPSSLLAPKTQSFAAAALPRIGRHFSTYKYNTLIEWIEGDIGKSVLASPGFRDPRTQVDRIYTYAPLKYEGVKRKEVLEMVVSKWIGGALHKLNVTNGRIDGYAIVGASGMGKTRFLSEIVEQWDRLRALGVDVKSAEPGTPSREIPADTMVFPIGFSNSTPVIDSERDIIKFLMNKDKFGHEVPFLAYFRCSFQ